MSYHNSFKFPSMARIGTEFWGNNYNTFADLENLPVTCGNKVCESSENINNCPVDCNPVNCNALLKEGTTSESSVEGEVV